MQLGRTVRYSNNRPIGKSYIAKYMKEACKHVGLNCTGHGLRGVSISTVVNKMGATAETLAHSRHQTVSGQRNYHRKNSQSEMAKFDALGVGGGLCNRPPTERTALPEVEIVNEPWPKKSKSNNSAGADDFSAAVTASKTKRAEQDQLARQRYQELRKDGIDAKTAMEKSREESGL